MSIRIAAFGAVFVMVAAPAFADDSATAGAQPQPGSTIWTRSDYISGLGGYARPDSRSMPDAAGVEQQGTQHRGSTFSLIYGNQLFTHWSIEGQVQGSVFQRKQTATTDFYQWGGTVDLVYGFTDRRNSVVTPYILGGVGAVYDDTATKDKTSFVAEGGLGLVTQPLYHSIRFRIEGRYNRDFFDGGQNDYRFLAGIEVPLGHVRVVEAPPEVRVEVKEVIKEVPRPWVDTDGDGVDDEHDLCPNTPKGLKVDATGCVIAGQQIVLNGVVFEFNKTKLVVNAQTILDTLAPAFLGQPTLKVEIAGHTDSIGSADYNQKLSQGRAEAVREYLISKGAKPEQLSAKGYGKAQPLITPEVTSEDRERNRRVEFRVLEK